MPPNGNDAFEETRRFVETEGFMDKTFEEAGDIIRARYPSVKWDSCGAFMDVRAMQAYLTKEEAERAGLVWE